MRIVVIVRWNIDLPWHTLDAVLMHSKASAMMVNTFTCSHAGAHAVASICWPSVWTLQAPSSVHLTSCI